MRGPCHGYGASVAVTWLTAFLDTAAPDAAATEAYWVAVTGWPLSARRGGGRGVRQPEPPDGDGPVRVQVVGTQPPEGCTSTCTPTTWAGWSSRRGDSGRDARYRAGLRVGRSPGGLVFCIVPHAGGRRPGPVGWPGGASLVDQVCLDIPPASFDRRGGFWSG